MISKQTLDSYFLVCHRFGFWAKILPWYWDPSSESFVLIRKDIKNRNRSSMAWLQVLLRSQVVVRLFVVLIGILKIRVTLNQSAERSGLFSGIFFLLISLMALPVHVQFCINGGAFVRHMNTLLRITKLAGTQQRRLKDSFAGHLLLFCL